MRPVLPDDLTTELPDTPLLLVVDDDADVRELLCDYLRQQGWHVLTTGTGEAALEMLRRHPDVDLVLLDVHLPGIDGFATLRRAAEMGVLAPMLMISTSPADGEQLHALGLSQQDYLTKPLDPEALTGRIRAMLALDPPGEPPVTIDVCGSQVDLEAGTLRRNGERLPLSEVQVSVLRVLLRYRGEVVSHKRLLGEALGIEREQVGFDMTLRTLSFLVDQHVEGLQALLEADPEHPVCLQRVFGQGYRLAVT